MSYPLSAQSARKAPPGVVENLGETNTRRDGPVGTGSAVGIPLQRSKPTICCCQLARRRPAYGQASQTARLKRLGRAHPIIVLKKAPTMSAINRHCAGSRTPQTRTRVRVAAIGILLIDVWNSRLSDGLGSPVQISPFFGSRPSRKSKRRRRGRWRRRPGSPSGACRKPGSCLPVQVTGGWSEASPKDRLVPLCECSVRLLDDGRAILPPAAGVESPGEQARPIQGAPIKSKNFRSRTYWPAYCRSYFTTRRTRPHSPGCTT